MAETKGLLVDIDDTLIRFKPNLIASDTGSLMCVLKQAGKELKHFREEDIFHRMEVVKQNVKWWSWIHFIEALELDPDEFWEYAFERESVYLEPTETDLQKTLTTLRDSGIRLFVTSNNPNAGIRHKLRLAGIAPTEIDSLFDGLLGATELTSMKWERDYWIKAVRLTGFATTQLAVVGDDFHDDYEVPRSAGLPKSFLLNRNSKYSTLPPRLGLTLILRISDVAEQKSF